MAIFMQNHPDGDSVALGRIPPSTTPWDLGARQYLSGVNSPSKMC